MGKLNLTYLDHDGESSTVGVRTVDLTAGNIAAQLALMDALQTAIDGIANGALKSKAVIAETEDFAATNPASGFTQREVKWLVTGVDSAGFNTTLEIPCADLSLLGANTGQLDISAGAGLAFKDALEDVWVSAQGNPVTVNAVYHVGRNI
jgi:hypothetical protein